MHWHRYVSFLPAAAKLGQGNIFTPVCDSVNGGGVPGLVPGGVPGRHHPPGPGTTLRDQVHPQDQVHPSFPPGTRYTPPNTANERPVRILL